jgi:transcription initiation factor TFIIIB Brf1 subunit/transcription initiation factor TFIIB
MTTFANLQNCNGTLCKSCKFKDIYQDTYTGDLICRSSGLVLDERSIHPEKSACKNSNGDFEETSKSVCVITNFTGYTTFNCSDLKKYKPTEAIDNLLRAKKQSYLSWEHLRLLKAKQEIERIACQLNIPEHIVIFVARTFRKLAQQNYLRGRKITLIISALFAETFQYYPIAWDIKELYECAGIINRNEFRTCRKNLNFYLQTHGFIPTELIEYQKDNRIIQHASNLINNCAIQFGLPLDLIPSYNRLIKRYSHLFHANAARGIAAAVIYRIAQQSGKYLSQNSIASILNVNEITLRNNYRILTNLIKQIRSKRDQKV